MASRRIVRSSSGVTSCEPRVSRCLRISLLCLLFSHLCAAFVVRSRPPFRFVPCLDNGRAQHPCRVKVRDDLVGLSSRSLSPRRCQRAPVATAACTTALQGERHRSAPRESVFGGAGLATARQHTMNEDEGDELLFVQLCHEAGVIPKDILRLDTSSTASSQPSSKDEADTAEFDSGVRGVYLNRGVRSGDVIVSIPLASCLRDDEPPIWYDCAATAASTSHLQDHDDDNNDDEEEEAESRPCMIAGSYNPSDWATRLAASLLHEQLTRQFSFRSASDTPKLSKATDLWLKLLPDPDWLRASLPVHWPSSVLQSSCCASLELAVDAAYFSRAEAAQDLTDALMSSRRSPWTTALRDLPTDRVQRMCDDALDVVQTRSCRVSVDLFSAPRDEVGDDQVTLAREVATPLRLLAPVFDMINHSNRPNAEFFVRYNDDGNPSGGGHLMVRALRDLSPGDQVLIDYGASTRPAYRCLASYGFVPAQQEDEDNGAGVDDDDDVAEVYIDGSRYEVTRATVPEDIVLAMAASPTSCAFVGTGLTIQEAESARLTPDIAIRLATRLSDVAYQLLLNPLHFDDDDHNDDDNNNHNDSDDEELPHDVLSARLAASLRWNQHRILLACALGLRDWAVRGSSS